VASHIRRNFTVVVCGPPCAGKSTLARQVSVGLRIPHLQMDRVCTRLMPDSLHDIADVDLAYHAMHALARSLLARNQSVIVDAPYSRFAQRCELEQITRQTSAALFVVQCRVEPGIAKARYLARTGHPGGDLTEEVVLRKAGDFPYCPVGIVLNMDVAAHKLANQVLRYIVSGLPVRRGKWSDCARCSAAPH